MNQETPETQGSKEPKKDFDVVALVEEQLQEESELLKQELQKGLYESEKKRRIDVIQKALVKGKELKKEVTSLNKPSQTLVNFKTKEEVKYMTKEEAGKLKKADEGYQSFLGLFNKVLNEPTSEAFQKLEKRLKGGKDKKDN